MDSRRKERVLLFQTTSIKGRPSCSSTTRSKSCVSIPAYFRAFKGSSYPTTKSKKGSRLVCDAGEPRVTRRMCNPLVGAPPWSDTDWPAPIFQYRGRSTRYNISPTSDIP